jgi:hypothetical protein
MNLIYTRVWPGIELWIRTQHLSMGIHLIVYIHASTFTFQKSSYVIDVFVDWWNNLAFWVMMSCSMVNWHQLFTGICWSHLVPWNVCSYPPYYMTPLCSISQHQLPPLWKYRILHWGVLYDKVFYFSSHFIWVLLWDVLWLKLEVGLASSHITYFFLPVGQGALCNNRWWG